jgi:hypothetical protein
LVWELASILLEFREKTKGARMNMNTPSLELFFSLEVAKELRKLFAIKTMEQLISLSQRDHVLDGVPEIIGIDANTFYTIIDDAKKKLGTIKHTGKKYALGALPTKK